MKTKTITKKNIKGLLKAAVEEWDVYTPLRNSGGDIWFDVLPKHGKPLDEALDNVVLGDVDTVISPKDIFFPQLESMFEYSKGEISEVVESSPKLLFGVAPCDLQGILFSDAFYKRNFEDKYYLSRIKDRFIVVKGCNTPPRATCFCVSAKTGPFAAGGYDLQLIEGADAYFVEVGSKKGEGFIKKHEKFFEDCPGDAKESLEAIKSKAAGAVDLKVDFQKALDMMSKDNFVPEENYKRIGERCIYCGACLYTCPTCTCFNVFDNVKDETTGQRVRTWDACVFEGYTRETSGHNPRKEKWQRTSRRYEHKLKYDHRLTGMSGCVACGRCLASCPVEIGISKFIQEITEKRKIM
ncbi:4Fe-4S dicluster domain-containing protein [Candidatus Woesearchaeota archaeon]|nr:4Fe-4S dicluster domain-containing protein [Candidatus Woesearchaeota archaeon]